MDREILEQRALILKALADPVRLQILEFLKDGDRCVCEIIPLTGRSQSTTSKNLDMLYRAGLLERKEDGRRTIYKIKNERVLELLNVLDSLIKEKLSCYMKAMESLGSRGTMEEKKR